MVWFVLSTGIRVFKTLGPPIHVDLRASVGDLPDCEIFR